MGGFHPTLVPDEVSEYAEAIIIGEAEGVWPEVIKDARDGRLKRIYPASTTAIVGGMKPDGRSSLASDTCHSAWSRPGAVAI